MTTLRTAAIASTDPMTAPTAGRAGTGTGTGANRGSGAGAGPRAHSSLGSRVLSAAAVAGVLAILIAGCSTTPAVTEPDGSLDGSWMLTSALDAQGTIPLTDAFISLRIGEGASSSQGPCNSYTADISGYGDNVTVANVLATQIACENPLLTEIESRYLADLATVTGGTVTAGELKLTGPDGLQLTFVLPRK
jgi:heat shock protein HslJ